MKAFLKVLVVALLASAAGLTGCVQQTQSSQAESVRVNSVQEKELKISVVLPATAEVVLKRGESKSGRLMGIDPQGKNLRLESGGDSAIVTLADIEKVTFKGEAMLYGNDRIFIRGVQNGESTSSGGKTWSEPLINFNLINPSEGEAELRLTSLSKAELQGIRAVAKDNSYVVEQMRFEPSEKMTIKVTLR